MSISRSNLLLLQIPALQKRMPLPMHQQTPKKRKRNQSKTNSSLENNDGCSGLFEIIGGFIELFSLFF
jgi:hypothetical protein